MFHDSQSESGSAGFSGTSVVGAVESFEYPRNIFLGNADSVVLNGNLEKPVPPFDPHVDISTRIAILDGVVYEVRKSLLYQLGIDSDLIFPAAIQLERNAVA